MKQTFLPLARRSLFSALVAVISFSGCSSAPKNEVVITPLSPARSIASIMEKAGLNCLANTRVFAEASDAPSFTEWVYAQKGSGMLTPDAAMALVEASPGKQTETLGLALAEADTYGDALLKEFDDLSAQGYTLEQMKTKSKSYAQLQALFNIHHDLHALVFRNFQERVIRKLAEMQAGGSDLLTTAGPVITKEALSFLDDLRAPIDARTKDRRYGTLAIAEVIQGLDQVRFFAESSQCGAKSPAGEFPEIDANSEVVIQAAKVPPQIQNAFRLFQTRLEKIQFPIVTMIRARAKQILSLWKAEEKSREPQSTANRTPSGEWGDFYFPSTTKKGNIIGSGFPKGVWALTYDDGPVSPHTEKVLANLKKNNFKATYFILSGNITSAGRPDLAKREKEAGHAMASHSYTHPQFTKISGAERIHQVYDAAMTFKSVLGEKPKFFRLPYGDGVNTPAIRQLLAGANMVHVYWNVDTLDWKDKNPDSVYRRALTQMKNSGQGVILFHDVHPQSVIASEMIMRYINDPANKLKAVTIPEIVDQLNGKTK